MTNSRFLTGETTLKNGVKLHNLNQLVGHDFDETERFLWDSYHGGNVNPNAWNSRVENDFVAVYECRVRSQSEYDRFTTMLLVAMADRLEHYPTFEEWHKNMVKIGDNRYIKMAKYLLKNGCPQSVIDFYSAQGKSGYVTKYLVISDRVQHIAGMSYYASGWSSCQHPDDNELCLHLNGSLHDDKLLIAFLIDEIEDLQDMEQKMDARTVCRILTLNGVQHLVPTEFYGSQDNRALLNECLVLCQELNVHGKEITEVGDYGTYINHRESANGAYEYTQYHAVALNETIDEYIDVTCPMCDGSGKYGVDVQDLMNECYTHEVKIECPLCDGSESYEVNVYAEIDEIKEDIEETHMIVPYVEGYEHYEEYIIIKLNEEYLEKHEIYSLHDQVAESL